MKLKERLTRLSKKKIPNCLQKRVCSCTNECDGVLKKVRNEKMDLEAALESRDADLNTLRSEVEFYRSLMTVRGMLRI